MIGPANRQQWITCEACGKRSYHSRASARAVRSQHPNRRGLAIYRCPADDRQFHLGHRPESLNRGEKTRDKVTRDSIR